MIMLMKNGLKPNNDTMIKRNHPFSQRQGFTILEMLVVVSVIALLASILLPALSSALKKAKITKVQVLIDSITVTLKQYRTDFGDYPPDGTVPGPGAVDSAACLYYYSAASFIAGNNSLDLSAGPYMEYRQSDRNDSGSNADLDGDGATDDDLYEVIDVWGNNLVFDSTTPIANNTNSFDIYSFGPDGADDSGGDDDITNWD